MSATQADPAPYYYSNTPAQFTITQFESVPPGCEIRYECIGVAGGPSPNVQCAIPGVTTFDGLYDGDSTDGTFTFGTFENI